MTTIPNPLYTYAFHPTPNKALFVSHYIQNPDLALTVGG